MFHASRKFGPAAGIHLGGLALACTLIPVASGQSDAQDAFFRAYYLEHEAGDSAGARAIYEQLASGSGVSAELRDKAQRALQGLHEEAAAADLASLVPEETLIYVELSQPGDRVLHLLDELGLTGEGVDFGRGRLSISPTLVEELLGLRGAAVAITNIDPSGGPPGGVAILHPGDLDIVRGLIETALPAGGRAADPIGGHTTYSIEGMAWVTVTERLIVASTERRLIEDVLGRLKSGSSAGSLAESQDLAPTMALRNNDLLFFCVNPEPVMPQLMGLVESQMGREPELALAMQLLDPESLQAIAGRLGVGDDGLGLDLTLQLDQDHQNVVFDLLRMPQLTRESLGMVPAGVAGFHAAGLNPTVKVPESSGPARVAAMDVGRELFGNLTHVAVFALPSMSAVAGQPIPDAALCMRVNDVEKSRALWHLFLSMGAMASGGSSTAMDAGGHPGRTYSLDGVPVHLVNCGNTLIVTPSQSALSAAIGATHEGKSVLSDEGFASTLQGLANGATSATAVHAGRVAELVMPMMSPRERQEMAPFLRLLADTTVALRTVQTERSLTFSAMVQGIPDISGVLGPLLAREMGGHAPAPRAAGNEVAIQATLAEDWARARDDAAVDHAQRAGDLRAEFEQAHHSGRSDDAQAILESLARSLDENAFELNNLAWALLTEDGYGQQFHARALTMAQRANELAHGGNWYYLDTLAHALATAGRLAEAVETQRKAIEVGADDPRIDEARAALAKFEKAMGKAKASPAGR